MREGTAKIVMRDNVVIYTVQMDEAKVVEIYEGLNTGKLKTVLIAGDGRLTIVVAAHLQAVEWEWKEAAE